MSSSSQPKVTVYRTRLCPFCVAAAAFLAERDIEVDEIYLDDHPNRQEVTDSILPGHSTVPLVVIGDRAIGGFDELRGLDARGELEALLGRAS